MRHNNKDNKRKPTSFTLSNDTIEKLEQYAKEHHTNKSQAITDLIWAVTCDDLVLVGKDGEGNFIFAPSPKPLIPKECFALPADDDIVLVGEDGEGNFTFAPSPKPQILEV